MSRTKRYIGWKKLTEEAAEELAEREERARNKYSLGATMEDEAQEYEERQREKKTKILDTVSTGNF